ncbi:hypothetical protein [Paenibacillus sp. MMO-177]|uniref:hypothetical protein n=1 Tax=Paenibacillus sp. MMO-177 TaxID=3081289 RepID=UPI00301B14F8
MSFKMNNAKLKNIKTNIGNTGVSKKSITFLKNTNVDFTIRNPLYIYSYDLDSWQLKYKLF